MRISVDSFGEIVRRVSRPAGILALLLICCGLSAQNETHRVRNIVWCTERGRMDRDGAAFTIFW